MIRDSATLSCNYLGGLSPEQNQVKGNRGISAAPRQMTYDRVLLANGWSGEYHGKYHSPYNYTRDGSGRTFYSQPLGWICFLPSES